MSTPAGHLIQCLHFGAMGDPERLVHCSRVVPERYVGRDGRVFVAEGSDPEPNRERLT